MVSNCNEMISILCDTEDMEKEIKDFKSRADDIIVLVENLIAKNSTEAMPQDEFQAKYDEYDKEHQSLLNKIEKNGRLIEEKQAKYLKAFITELKNQPLVLETWDKDVWSYLIDKATVNSDGTITFLFRNGKEKNVR